MPGDLPVKTGGGYTNPPAPSTTPVQTAKKTTTVVKKTTAPAPTKTTATKTTTTKTPGPVATTQGGSINAKTLAVDYGFALAVLNSDPGLRNIFNQAVKQTWSIDKFTAELRGTKWFQTHSDNARQWAILAAADPATAAARRQARVATMKAYAGQLGVPLTSTQLNSMVNNSLMLGWTEDQTRQVMGAGWKYLPTTPSYGLAGQTVDTLKKTAADYAIPLSDSTIQGWGQRVIEGLATPQDFTNYAIQQAKSLFPTMAAELDKGVTVAQYADPYKQSASQILGINPEDFNLMDPKWRESIDKVNPTTGQRTVQSLADWQTQLRTDTRYGYDKTAGARQQASALVDGLGKMMGFVG